jgi:hypothetical protein
LAADEIGGGVSETISDGLIDSTVKLISEPI